MTNPGPPPNPTAAATGPAIRQATPADIDPVADLLAEAFLHTDLAPFLVPAIDARLAIYRDYFRLHAAHAVNVGWVDVAGAFDGVAVWYEVKHDPAEDLTIPDYDNRLADACGPCTPRFAALDHAMLTHHPAGIAHHYLALLAVHPDRQRHGIGSALLEHHHQILDTVAVPAYLEATSTRVGAFYLRHHYRRQRPFLIADNTRLYPMWRTPRTAFAPPPPWTADTTDGTVGDGDP